ncbi:hypothetical protein CARUB_v10003770mg [Capsella rubella]|uniref:DM13 domain-containing protein n=1 Tax=Capsella rubella TaxID=81985 RepID=R0H804_9BRAS|nr:hypothetical protein CARUB_v10003770mg [Capsella rubella]
MCDQRPVFLGSLVLMGFFLFYVNGEECSNSSSLIGHKFEFMMLQHQLRGVFTVVDDCSFRVSRFDMLSGSDVHWLGAMSSGFENMTKDGFVIYDQKLNQTFKTVSFIVQLMGNVTWDKLGVVSVWDLLTASDFAEPPPLESIDVTVGKSYISEAFKVPTMFDKCYVDIGLEATTGWAKPNSTSNLMLNADVLVTGIREDGFPFADDFYIMKSSVCSVKEGTASGVVESENFGHFSLNLSDHVDECLGPLDADNKYAQDVIIADANAPLIVTAGPSVHYPNPPNPLKVLYINKKEAPVLKVEGGVLVKFLIEAGHEVSFYMTSDFLGGNASLRNRAEPIYAGGQETHGVLASLSELVWAPNKNTPDELYYNSIFQEKIGWKVHVVEGGLSRICTTTVLIQMISKLSSFGP